MCGHKLTYIIRGAIYEVHKMLGCGLLEECYHQALVRELQLRGLKVKSKVKVPVVYKGMEIKNAYVLDILVEDKVIIELKSVEELTNLHYKQLINYLHLKIFILVILSILIQSISLKTKISNEYLITRLLINQIFKNFLRINNNRMNKIWHEEIKEKKEIILF